MTDIKTSGDGFYIVENDGAITVLSRSHGEWYDFSSGDYATYDISPTRVIKKVNLEEGE
jgi:hypothetical protein